MSALDTEAADALLEIIGEVGEQVTIDLTTVSAYVNSATQIDELVSGGYYGHRSYTVLVRKADISFVPTAGMYVVARGENLRIADDGVHVGRVLYRLTVIGRDVPQR